MKQIKITIEGKSEKTWNMPGASVSITDEPMKYFVLLVSKSAKYDYYIHFENETKTPYTDSEKDALFSGIANLVEDGEVVTTSGGVTPGGISAMHKLTNYGFKIIGWHKGLSQVYWASQRLFDEEKFNKWVQGASKHECELIDKNLPPTKENTKPVVPILKKIEKKK